MARPVRTGSVAVWVAQAELEDEHVGPGQLLGERRPLDALEIARQSLAFLGNEDRPGEAHALPGRGKAGDEVGAGGHHHDRRSIGER